MRLALGAISHETNTFSRTRTSIQQFEEYQYHQGDAITQLYKETATTIGGYLDAADELGVEILPILAAYAVPSGLVTGDALTTLTDELCERLRRVHHQIDGVLLDLHGAMVSEIADDADGYILERIRAVVGRETPIGVVIDFHANLTQKMVNLADILVGFDDYPHIDMRDRAREVATLLTGVVQRRVEPVKAWRALPLLTPLHGQFTGRRPMQDLMALAHEAEADDRVLNVTSAPGFPYSDVQDAGMSVLVTTDGDPTYAAELADRIAAAAWERRHEFNTPTLTTEEAIHQAMAGRSGPWVLADLGDNPGGGAPCDGTALLWGLIDLGARNAALGIIVDPEAVDAAIAGGVGSTIQVSVGGKVDRRHGYPIDIEARVERITDGRFRRSGPMAAGMPVDLGRTAVLRAAARHDGDVQIIVTEKRAQPSDLMFFRYHGIEPTEKQIVVVKSSVHFRAAFEPIAEHVIDVATPGITTPEFGFFDYRHVKRPIVPLDGM